MRQPHSTSAQMESPETLEHERDGHPNGQGGPLPLTWTERIRDALPRGRLLSEAEWTRRHRDITVLVWVHVVAVAAFGLWLGYGAVHSLVEAGIIAVPGILAIWAKGRTERTTAASLGLLLSSAIIVHLSGGMIEAHFHFFVMVGVLTLYQDWVPFIIAIVFVVVHHAAAGLIDPRSVFNHSGAWRNPGQWALVHGGFVVASSSAYVIQWRLNERARLEAAESYRRLRASEERFRSLVINAMEAIAVVDAEGRVTYQSPSVARVLGYSAGHLLGSSGFDYIHPDDVEHALEVFREVSAKPGTSAVLELRARDAQGAWQWIDARATNLLEDPNVRGIVANFRNITERKTLEDQLTVQAFHDPLTGLANRLLLTDRLRHCLDRVARYKQPLSLIFMDLDNFKRINDSLGHEVGDQLLRDIGEFLQDTIRALDTAARLGGDEFAILLEDTPESGATEVARRILSSLEKPLRVGDRDLYVSASLGMFVSRSGTESVGDLLRNADLAMYVAKGRGKGTYAVFEPEMYSSSLESLSLSTDLRSALERDELLLFYQPIVDLDTGQISGLEALARWKHPVRGLLSPAEFIPVAEESNLIIDVGKRLLYMACAQTQAWRKMLSPGLKVSVNLSARQLEDANLVRTVRDALDMTGLPPENLILEVTESMLMGNVEATVSQLTALRRLGICIAIDDFGTGHSSLGLLKRLPVDIMKIDRTFIHSMTEGTQDVAFVEAMLNLGGSLQLRTVAEGIETQQQTRLLKELECPDGQGYLFAKPMDPTDTEIFISSFDGLPEAAAPDGVQERTPAEV
jgi:diguanylate cyclase (GGDEF)-like protein/PAS domain S-box-containing protein